MDKDVIFAEIMKGIFAITVLSLVAGYFMALYMMIMQIGKPEPVCFDQQQIERIEVKSQ